MTNKKYLLGEMTWEEAKEAIEQSDFVILPTGSVEQHSIHCPLLVDSIHAEELAKHIAEASNDLSFVVLPTLYYGYSWHHMHYPGTITLDAHTFERVIEEIGRCLHMHKAKRFFIITGHGGNREPIKFAAGTLQRELNMKVYAWPPRGWEFSTDKEIMEVNKINHAGKLETSLIMHLRPDLVRRDKIEKQKRKGPLMLKMQPEERWTEDSRVQGGIGDPTQASAEYGKEVLEKEVEAIIEALKANIQEEFW